MRKIKISIQQDMDNGWYWRMERSGRLLAKSERYARRDSARKGALSFAEALQDGNYEFADERDDG